MAVGPGGAPGTENGASFQEQRAPEIARTKGVAAAAWKAEAHSRLASPDALTPEQKDKLGMSELILTGEPQGKVRKKK